MKVVANRVETKKRKRDNSKEPITDSPKKAKVHAQRKFAQGAAYNSSVITPIKDKVRRSNATPSSGPMLTNKCPNTEDFLTFLCFRRTSILPPKLDFFKEATGCDKDSEVVNTHKSTPEKYSGSSPTKKQNFKKNNTNDLKKKSQPAQPSVQALRKKYQEQRLAKQKVTNVTKLAQKVKGKNMVRTRASANVEEAKIVPKERISNKVNKTISAGLRSGLKRVQHVVTKPPKKLVQSRKLRAGLRSGGSRPTAVEKIVTVNKTTVVNNKKLNKEIKKPQIQVSQNRLKGMKLKKVEGFSDFSSDDNEPLMSVKKPKIEPKKTLRSPMRVEDVKEDEKTLVKTRSQVNESESPRTARPTRKTKEAAALYVEMITKKLVSPDKSGDDDISSVDSFPELPNAKKNEQRETEIKARALAVKRAELKLTEEKTKELKSNILKNEASNTDSKKVTSKNLQKASSPVKKETKLKREDSQTTGKATLKNIKEKQNSSDAEKKEQDVPNRRPSTRSRPIEEPQVDLKSVTNKLGTKKGLKSKQSLGNEETEKSTQSNKKGKIKANKTIHKEEEDENEKSSKTPSDVPHSPDKQEKEIKKGLDKQTGKEVDEKTKEETNKKNRKSTAENKLIAEKESEIKSPVTNPRSINKKESKIEISNKTESRRPTRKCSAADKICFEIDGFTSDEDDFDSTFVVTKTRSANKKATAPKEKDNSKNELDKKPNKLLTVGQSVSKNESVEATMEEDKEEARKTKCKSETKSHAEKEKVQDLKPEIMNELKQNENADKNSANLNEHVKNENSTVPAKRAKVCNSDKKEEKPSKNVTESSAGKLVSETSKNSGDKKTKEGKKGIVEQPSVKEAGAKEKTNSKNEESVQKVTKKRKDAKKDSEERKEVPGKSETKPSKAVKQKKTEVSRNLKSSKPKPDEKSENEDENSNKRTRPVRQCSTGEKRWIETDSDSFSFYDTSDEDDNLLIFGFDSTSKEKSSPAGTETKKPLSLPVVQEKKAEKVTKTVEKSDNRVENFSDSDEEPLKKKPLLVDNICLQMGPVKEVTPEINQLISPVKFNRDVPALNPLKKTPSDTHLVPVPLGAKPVVAEIEPPVISIPETNETKSMFYEIKTFGGKPGPSVSNVPVIRSPMKPQDNPPCRSHFFTDHMGGPVVSVPNRIEMILHSLKKEKLPEQPTNYSSDVKVTFGNVPYHPMAHSSQLIQPPCSYQVKPMINFPQPREPISTHGLDLLSEVALPTTPKGKLNSQTERIEKWLKDSQVADEKKTFPNYEDSECKVIAERVKKSSSGKQESGLFYGKPVNLPPVSVSSHTEMHKLSQVDLLASQRLLKKNVLAADAGRIEQQQTHQKKVLTSVQDLLKLQKERKEVAKSPVENSQHLKNCKCNNCIVKKGWFKNKPVPKVDQQKLSPIDDGEDSVKPFESLTKAFKAVEHSQAKPSTDAKTSKMSVSIAPIVVTGSSPDSKSVSTSSKELSDRKGTMQQRKLSFLERMKERERKEAAAMKSIANAFSANNESSVYAFEPEPERTDRTPGQNVPMKNKTRDSRTSSTSKSDDDCLKICEDESSISSGTQPDKSPTESKRTSKSSQSASIAVQVNLDTETVTEVEATIPDVQDGKSIEISTQTEVPEEDSDSPMFYIPLQQATGTRTTGSSDQQLIQGVALKLGTEGPMGPNQRVVMKAKLVTKPPDTPSIKAVVMPQPKRIFDQKNNNPPIGTVQPTTRKPPEDVKTKDSSTEASPKEVSTAVAQTSTEPATPKAERLPSKPSKASAAAVSKPPSKNREKTKEQNSSKETPEGTDECSPSSSASSSKSKRPSKQKSSETVINPSSTASSTSRLVEAPTFYATEKDFQDPFEFFERIRPAAEKFGLCRIVPPSSFKPDCKVSDDMRFTAYNQYVHRMFHRWGPNIKETMAIKKYLATQSISLKQPPWIGGIEIDLPRLYQSVQNCGGLMKVMEKKKWHQVADMMRIPKAAQDRVTKLDGIYCKYLLPYDTLSHDERQKLFDEVEKDWAERQKNSPGSTDAQGEDEAEEENYIDECEECVVRGRNMALNQFYRIARNTMSMWFKNAEPSPREVENEFWKHVSERNHHVCVHSGSIDSSGWGYGFPSAKNNSFSKHPWNLKVLTNNSRSVLRSLGPAMGVTVPTLHVGMVFTAFCWYRDPHGLPWIEYLHTGAPKIWYGISDDNSAVFQEALNKLLPRYIKNKTIWLPSDTAMIPPTLLVENGVSLCHTVQEPGQFILVFPRSFISSICTGYLVSESVYFAQSSWLTTAEQAFKDIQESCEPSMFSLEKLLFSIATDSRSSVEVLKQVLPMVWHVRQKEIDGRKTLFNLGLKTSERLPSKESGGKKARGRWARDDDGDYECEVCRMNLFVSLVTNSQEEGTYCLPHAIDLLTQKRHQLKYCKLLYTFTQEEMNNLVEKLEQKIESKSQKKPLKEGKSSTSK
ncbi:hypothetical protein RUM44_010061 [Polyplax serrata]|uniref:Protein Jumonji n=1 Tax=Polyplax serrata TaxID=468196 RepID=A0ABR1AUF2_POLSC